MDLYIMKHTKPKYQKYKKYGQFCILITLCVNYGLWGSLQDGSDVLWSTIGNEEVQEILVGPQCWIQIIVIVKVN